MSSAAAPHTHWPRVVTTAVGLVALVAVVVLAFLWPSVTAEPRDLPVAAAGDPAVVAQVQAALDQNAEGAIELVTVADRDAAVDLVESRDAYGALVLGQQPEVLTASAASPAVAQLLAGLQPALQAQVSAAATAQGVPAEAVPTVAVTDVVPLSADDPRGSTLAAASFPLVLGGMVGGIAISLAVVGVWRRVAALGVYSVIGGLAIAGILHGIGGLHGAYLADSLAVALTLLGIGSTIVGAVAVLGRPGIAVGPVLFLLVANPLSASAMPVEFLLSPWGAVGQWFPPGASATLLRDLSYFPAADTTFPWLVLTGWAVLGLLLSLVGHFRDRGAATAAALREADGVAPAAEPVGSAR
ncbi:ABC transporter permease [Cellulosimicrobium cellulans]|uniref:Membrane protein n=1 Tax=Cellulosimicrobium cellulans TaxID=1710 RepID=A0A4Y4DYD1_CELCE|nr:ABC transporter permease [Cellulosimicrobium cellulans]GED10402.1 membrane protein [Cellulosimicrobium cellulans]